jgi:hypothetical protein
LSCRKESFTTDTADKLSFSTDTLTFDTVFSSVGSTTAFFKLINTHPKKIRVSNILLSGGEASQFRINIDGIPSFSQEDVELAAGDSMYVFVEVTVDPNSDLSPFIIKDSLIFITNGNEQKVMLIAWGQNANFYNGEIIGDTSWTNEKPHVIYNSILVDSGKILTIEKGCALYFHSGSRLYVNGTLIINGSIEERVILQGDRLEEFYQNKPGQWEGVHFLRGSISNKISHANIKNSIVGIRVDSLPENSDTGLVVRNTEINNILSSGIIGITANIHAYNTLIYNIGQHALQLEYGGEYHFEHCTFSGYSSNIISHKDPILRMSNYFEGNNTIYASDYFNASFLNTILNGSMEDEIGIDFYSDPNIMHQYTMDHCLIKSKEHSSDSNFISSIINQDPEFESISEDIYLLSASSPCIDAGTSSNLAYDIIGVSRPQGTSHDIGCFEFE